MSFRDAPASLSVASMFAKVCRVCASKLPASELPAGSFCPVWPAIQTTLPPSVITAGENARDFCHVPRTNDFFMAPPPWPTAQPARVRLISGCPLRRQTNGRPVNEKLANNEHSVQPRRRLHQDRFRKFRGQMVEEHAHGRQQPLPVGEQSRDRRINDQGSLIDHSVVQRTSFVVTGVISLDDGTAQACFNLS